MSLEEPIAKYNKSLSDRLISMKLGDLVGSEVDYHNYSLFDFINVFKIKRLTECGYINESVEKDLMDALRRYRTKLSETVAYGKNKVFTDETKRQAVYDKAMKDMVNARKELISYGIDPNINNTIKLEDIINFDIRRRSIYNIQNDATRAFPSDIIKQLGEQFSARIFRITKKDKDYLELYNLLKLEYLKNQKYIGTNDKDIVEKEYISYKTNKDENIKTELSNDPYNLIFDMLQFDFTSFIDYLNVKAATIYGFDDTRGIYEDELSGNIR